MGLNNDQNVWTRSDDRKRADGEGLCDWDSEQAPKTRHFESEEAFRKAYEQWRRHVQRQIGIDPKNWPHRMNVGDTCDMCKEVFNISRSTFYRTYRLLFEFEAQGLIPGRKEAFREDVIERILESDNIDRNPHEWE
jgi:hypothetical protein